MGCGRMQESPPQVGVVKPTPQIIPGGTPSGGKPIIPGQTGYSGGNPPPPRPDFIPPKYPGGQVGIGDFERNQPFGGGFDMGGNYTPPDPASFGGRGGRGGRGSREVPPTPAPPYLNGGCATSNIPDGGPAGSPRTNRGGGEGGVCDFGMKLSTPTAGGRPSPLKHGIVATPSINCETAVCT